MDPFPGSWYFISLFDAYLNLDRYEEAITVLKKVLHYQADFLGAHIFLAVCYATLGREEEAHAEAAIERYVDALRKAGLK
jgi:hypothetical protein